MSDFPSWTSSYFHLQIAPWPMNSILPCQKIKATYATLSFYIECIIYALPICSELFCRVKWRLMILIHGFSLFLRICAALFQGQTMTL